MVTLSLVRSKEVHIESVALEGKEKTLIVRTIRAGIFLFICQMSLLSAPMANAYFEYVERNPAPANPIAIKLLEMACLNVSTPSIPFLLGAYQLPREKEYAVKVTGYYAPNPKQKRFLHGSYRKEVKVNGSGKITATGTKPQPGTVAANLSRFEPGTIVFIRKYGFIGRIEDTGQKMRENWSRIDLYCGRGEKALRKAESFNSGEWATMEIIQVAKL